jgi:hypothetical protein
LCAQRLSGNSQSAPTLEHLALAQLRLRFPQMLR